MTNKIQKIFNMISWGSSSSSGAVATNGYANKGSANIEKFPNQEIFRSFAGWTMRFHPANNGYVIEAWHSDYDYDGPRTTGPEKKRKLFTISDEENMGEALSKIFTLLNLL